MAIYTKRGDGGETGLFTPKGKKEKRVDKDSLIIETIGAIDELNSFLGLTVSFSNNAQLTSYLKDIQKNLMSINSINAGKDLDFTSKETKKLEKVIDEFDKNISPLSNFILPGGTVFAAHLQYARTLVRRVERRIVSLSKEEKIKPQILAYLNRLSDFLFIMARYVNFEARVDEVLWPERKKK